MFRCFAKKHSTLEHWVCIWFYNLGENVVINNNAHEFNFGACAYAVRGRSAANSERSRSTRAARLTPTKTRARRMRPRRTPQTITHCSYYLFLTNVRELFHYRFKFKCVCKFSYRGFLKHVCIKWYWFANLCSYLVEISLVCLRSNKNKKYF